MTFDRSELEKLRDSWEQANVDVEKAGDWRPLADFYTDDATYCLLYTSPSPRD